MSSPPSPSQLRALVEEATIDCYDEGEQLSGLFCALDENVPIPFHTTVLGLPVTVQGLDQSEHDIVADCCSGSHRQKISLLHLPLPDPLPPGAEWIFAYRHWRG